MPEVALQEGSQKILEHLIGSLGHSLSDVKKDALVRLPQASNGDVTHLAFYDDVPDITDADRFVNCLAALLVNTELDDVKSIRLVMNAIDKLLTTLNGKIQGDIHLVLHSPKFRELEANWRSLGDLCAHVNSEEVIVDFLDVTKGELEVDLEDHSSYILTSALFKKLYVEEYDRYGGKPFGCMVGLYEFDAGRDDIEWLKTMSKLSSASHAPFISAVAPEFFGFGSWEDLGTATDLDELLSLPKYGAWNAFRESDAAAYIGLTLPRYLLREPWQDEPGWDAALDFSEQIDSPDDYLWGNAAVPFARNMIRSFETSGWCQHICGPRGGGMVKGLPVHVVTHHGQEELQPPVQVAIPDYRELQFAKNGFIPLIHCKGTADATFFSARSIKKAIEFESELDTKNADLVCNLAYTMSVTRIAHYVKRMVREYIGSSADGSYIQTMLETWLIDYVTTAVNPDDLTLRYYPFKAISVQVVPRPGPFGWYNCVISVLPHIQFQGMDVELRLEAALGG
jgi:type VI secretion system protein ImpC